jgi:hypothetical protein
MTTPCEIFFIVEPVPFALAKMKSRAGGRLKPVPDKRVVSCVKVNPCYAVTAAVCLNINSNVGS